MSICSFSSSSSFFSTPPLTPPSPPSPPSPPPSPQKLNLCTFPEPSLKWVPFVNFAPLLNNLEHLKVESDSFQKAWTDYFGQEKRLSPVDLKAINRLLYQAEQELVLDDGLPRRPWFRHQVYAPGFYTGYGVKTFPGIREAIEEAEWEQIDEQVGRAAGVIWTFAERVSQASALLRAAEGNRND